MSLTVAFPVLQQIYPENTAQAEMLVSSAIKVGFSGGLVVDYPHSTRAKKYFLVLMVGSSSMVPQPKGLDGIEPESDAEMADADGVQVMGSRHRNKRRKSADSSGGKGKEWLLKKKERMRHKGYEHIPPDTKYSGRKRRRTL